MILLYQLPKTEKGQLVTAFFDRIKKNYVVAQEEQAGLTPAELFGGSTTLKGAERSVSDSAIFFSPEETEEDARELLELLSQAGIRFRFQVLVDDVVAQRPIADILTEQAEHQALIKTLRNLQDLIDRCDNLRQEDYDPDRWSELKFSIADANDTLDAVFSDNDDIAKVGRAHLEERTEALRVSLERMLTYKRPE